MIDCKILYWLVESQSWRIYHSWRFIAVPVNSMLSFTLYISLCASGKCNLFATMRECFIGWFYTQTSGKSSKSADGTYVSVVSLLGNSACFWRCLCLVLWLYIGSSVTDSFTTLTLLLFSVLCSFCVKHGFLPRGALCACAACVVIIVIILSLRLVFHFFNTCEPS